MNTTASAPTPPSLTIDPLTYCSLAAAANLGFTPRMVRDRGLIQTRAQERFYVDLLSAAEALRRQGKCLDVPNWTI